MNQVLGWSSSARHEKIDHICSCGLHTAPWLLCLKISFLTRARCRLFAGGGTYFQVPAIALLVSAWADEGLSLQGMFQIDGTFQQTYSQMSMTWFSPSRLGHFCAGTNASSKMVL